MILPLLRSLYDPSAPLPTDLRPDGETMKDIEFFQIAPQVYTLLRNQGRLEQVPDSFCQRLEELYNQTLLQNVYIKFETEQLLKVLEQAEIPVIPLKGVRFAEAYFGHLAARGTTDIDLLIRPGDLERAKASVKQLGFRREGRPIPSHFHDSFAKPLPGSPHPLSVELHWDLLADRTSNFAVEPLWERARPLPSYRHVMELAEQDTFYMICLHGWKHALDSLKYFIDIVQVLHTAAGRIDYGTLLAEASEHRTYRRMRSTLSIVYQQFPHLERIKPLPIAMLERTWWDYGTIRRRSGRDPSRYFRFLQYQWFDFDMPKHSLAASIQYWQSMRKRRGGR